MPVRKVFNQTISVLKYGRWGIPVVAVAAMLSVLLDFPEQSCQEICTAGGLAGEFNRSSLTCLALGTLLLGTGLRWMVGSTGRRWSGGRWR